MNSSVVKPDSATYIVNQKLMLPVLAGDPVQWSFFEMSLNKSLDSRAKLEGEDASAEQQVARARQIVLSHGRQGQRPGQVRRSPVDRPSWVHAPETENL